MKLRLFAFATLAVLAGCNGTRIEEPVVATIVEVYTDPSPMGCIGTDWNTIVRLTDLRTARLCGRYGKPGEKISGCWITGYSDPSFNGFDLKCQGTQK